MIQYDDLCHALDRFNQRRNNQAEMASLEDEGAQAGARRAAAATVDALVQESAFASAEAAFGDLPADSPLYDEATQISPPIHEVPTETGAEEEIEHEIDDEIDDEIEHEIDHESEDESEDKL